MQCIVREGEELIFALHEDGQDLTGLYGGGTFEVEGQPVTVPAGTVVQVPRGFRFAYDDEGLAKDPRRWAGEGSTPLGP